MHVYRNLDALPRIHHPILTIGSFDGVHLGHRELLRRIREQAMRVGGESVVVTFDPHPRHVLALNGSNPVRLLTTTAEKIERLAAEGIDHCVVVNFTPAFAAQTANEYLDDFLFGKFSPHTVVIGYDHRFGQGRTGDIELLRNKAAASGVVVDEIAARDVDDMAVSSTRIRRAISAGAVAEANQLLGSPYPLTGRVVHGDAIGRTIGFPTANLDLETTHKLLPADGVYAVRARRFEHSMTDDAKQGQPAMLYIGERPSLEGKRPRSIEVNLLDFDGDLYGELMRVDVIDHLRNDAAFGSLEELQAQLQRDREAAVARLARP